MKYSQFDRYAPYVKAAALLIALLTFWRFRQIDLSSVYGYVAQGDVLRSAVFQTVMPARSVVWDFFGLIDKFVTPGSVMFIRISGLVIVILDLYLVARILEYMTGQRFWGFLGMFLVALSPFAIIAAVAGGPAASAAFIALLFLLALYRNQYVYAALLAGLGFASSLPALVMFLITILDLLQNATDRRRLFTQLLSTAAAFAGVVVVLYLYSALTGNAKMFSIMLGERDMSWSIAAVIPFLTANILNIAGVTYLVAKNRYDAYRTHFHTLMMWITSSAYCVAYPSGSNLLVAMAVSTALAIFFLQGFGALWTVKLISADTFVFVITVLFLFGNLYTNNTFLRNIMLKDSIEKRETVAEVVDAIESQGERTIVVSNFAPAELSVKLGRKVFEAGADVLPIGEFESPSSSVLFVVKRRASVDSLAPGCKNILTTSMDEGGRSYSVQVVRYSEN